tara:strand:- start:234 stop:674 length:441 start_codon:yes stop_codon:yes gene_type:complete
MKKLLILLLFPICVIGQTKHYPYAELNGGIAINWEKNLCSTASALIGTTIDMGDYSLIDLQIGLAIPSRITGKVGVGSYFGKNESISLLAGCRIYPLMFYSQLILGQREALQFIMCGEIGGGGPKSLNFRSMFNVGFRCHIKTKQR